MSSMQNYTLNPEEDLYVLKFPTKLWFILNECKSGAIRWGRTGKTIIIDYNLFQAEYLNCKTPKFKTRNMTSFVRQMNMYGFKKVQNQLPSAASRHFNIHEFYHENFRYGRPDLLSEVKRRLPPIRAEKTAAKDNFRLQLLRNAFDDALIASPEMQLFWDSLASSGDKTVLMPGYKCRLIPVTLQNVVDSKIIFDLDSKFKDYVSFNSNEEEEEDDSDSSGTDKDEEASETESILEKANIIEEFSGAENICTSGYDQSNFLINFQQKIQQNNLSMQEEVPTIKIEKDPPLPDENEENE